MRTYEKYKDSGISWLQGQQIPYGWTTCKLKNTAKSKGCLFIDGDWIESKNIIPDSNIIYTTTGNVGPGYFKYQSLGHISEQTFVDLNCTEVKPGDLVISRLNEPIGRACIFPKLGDKMITAVDNVILRPDLEKYNKRYLMYQMNSPKYTISANLVARGATMHRISRSMLGDIQLIVPPLYEQEAIANYLDKKTAEIDKIIAEREKKIELLNDLKSSIISHAVTKGINPHAKMKDSGIDWIGEIPEGWNVGRFKYYFRVCKGLTITKADLVDEGIPVISYGQVHSKDNSGTCLKESLFRYVPHSYLQSDKNSLVNKGDFIFADTSEDIAGCGNCVYVDRNMTLFAGYHSIIAKSIHTDDCKFFSYLFLTDNWRKQIRNRVSGVKVFSITQDYLKNTTLIIPPITEQQVITDYLDKKTSEIDSAIATIKEECILYKEYKQSLISEVVTGKRKVID